MPIDTEVRLEHEPTTTGLYFLQGVSLTDGWLTMHVEQDGPSQTELYRAQQEAHRQNGRADFDFVVALIDTTPLAAVSIVASKDMSVVAVRLDPAADWAVHEPCVFEAFRSALAHQDQTLSIHQLA